MKRSKAFLKKIAIRNLVATLVFLIVKYTLYSDQFIFELNKVSVFYFLSTLFLFMFGWESNDWFIKKKLELNLETLTLKSGLRILGLNMLLMTPIVVICYYIGIYHLDNYCSSKYPNAFAQFITDIIRALLLSFSVIVFNLFYFSLTQKQALSNNINQLKKELITAQYQSLKSQLSPHFLFNSLNTLTTLIYDDKDLASDFVSRLASCYRYLLDHQDDDLVSLHKELTFLDSFIFMMTVRHHKALKINLKIDDDFKNLKIPTLSLQMLLENALKHNIYSPQKPLTIDIFSNSNKSITIKNNLQIRNLKEETTCLGIKNIEKRYALYTLKKVEIINTESLYSITIPLIQNNL